MEADASAVTTDLSRDSTAGFMVTVGETKLNTTGFTAYTVPVGKGFRKLAPDSRGNQRATIIVALPPKPGERGQTVVRIDGDPARADSLLQAAKH